MSTLSQFLSADHRRCDDLIIAAEHAIAAQAWTRGARLFNDFHDTVERHLAMEEQVLFVAYEAAAGAQGPSQVMRMEHEQIRALLASMARAVREHAGAEFLGLTETLLVLMQQHNMKEEHILYPLCDRLLAEDAEDLIAHMRSVTTGLVTEAEPV